MMTDTITEHNAEAAEVWAAFHAGQPIRPPVFLGTNTQYFIFNEALNPGEAVTFESYTQSGRTMLEFQLRAAVWRAEHIAPHCDDPLGLPDTFQVKVDLQNFDEAAYFGAPVLFLPHQVPDTTPILAGDRKNALFDAGLPDPLTGNWYQQAHRLYQEMSEIITGRSTWLERPIKILPFGIYTTGPLTLAHQLRGNELFMDFYDDPDYVHHLLDYIVTGTIARIRAHHRFFGLPELAPTLFYADDSIQMISGEMLAEFVLPAHARLKAGVTSADKVKIHLCGDATRHFKALKEHIGVFHFETGFPIEFGQVRQDVGPEVILEGGPNIMLLKDGTPAAVTAETERIFNSGVLEGGNFILREGNNLAPGTPLDNLAAMYQAARHYRYLTPA
jgi:hypothetical protein